MSTREIASLPAIGLTTKGVGSVIERMKHSIRDRILGQGADSDDNQEEVKKQSPFETRIAIRGVSELGPTTGQTPR
jgi:hypothetical protein